MRRRRPRDDAKAWIGSALVHGTLVAVAFLTTMVEPRPLEYETFEINMVQSVEEERLVVETPNPSPPQPVEQEPEPEPVVEKPPEPKPPEPKPREPEPKPDPPKPDPPKPEPPTPDPPRPEARPQPADIDARMEGLRKDYPEYYANIQFQIKRCFRWTSGGSWKATVDFVINKDGTIANRDIDVARASGSLPFDLAAVEAIECASGKLGRLPDDLPYERLPVRFNFSPMG